MASKQPAHGGAETSEFDLNLIADDIHRPGDPECAEVSISVDMNGALRVEISASEESDWQLDARMVNSDLDIVHAFRGRDAVVDDEIPEWVKRVAGAVGDRLQGGDV